jgi:hypothetical protein
MTSSPPKLAIARLNASKPCSDCALPREAPRADDDGARRTEYVAVAKIDVDTATIAVAAFNDVLKMEEEDLFFPPLPSLSPLLLLRNKSACVSDEEDIVSSRPRTWCCDVRALSSRDKKKKKI